VSDVVRVAVVGTGRMGALHVSTYQRMENVHLVAVSDPSSAARRRALRGATGVREHDDWRDLFAAEASALDAVSIACSSSLHAEVALAALAQGLHVLVEKPIATTLPDALRMRAAALDAGRKLMVGHVERFNPAVAKLRELVRAGRLGEIFRIQATRVGPSPLGVPDTGVVLDLASHDLDIMQFVLGQDITQVIATGGSFQHGPHEDLVTCLLRFTGGALGLLDANWVSPEKQREVVLLGAAGSLRADYITQDVWFVESSATGSAPGWEELAFIRGDGEGAATRFGLHKVEPIRAELDAFADCILTDSPEPVGAHDGARALAAALAIRESLRSGRSVRLLEMPEPQPARSLAGLS
jgi:UDP-N-acetylglucosamine 3-dehydrogenase